MQRPVRVALWTIAAVIVWAVVGVAPKGVFIVAAAAQPNGADETAAPAVQDGPDFAEWLAEFKRDAIADGISPALVEKAFTDVAPVPRIVERDRNQAEFVLTFDTYLSRVVTPTNVAVGRKKMAEHRELLRAVGEKYGVQPRFIVAIWGIETRYGAVKPTMPVIPALATLAWDRRRSKFFRNELLQALHMLDKGYADLDKLNGSWAGAMGQPQFIPSSYMNFAQDWDGDGKRDIWDNPGDVFASIANYLARHGWSDDQTWGREVKVPEDFSSRLALMRRTKKSGCRAIDGMSMSRGLNEWQSMGVRRADGRDLPTRNLPGSLVQADGETGPVFMVYKNYHAILRYNCAHFYGLTVGTLSDRLR
ncbi:MAG TPA: lytic murein transglycosylase [Alphaproteobacteria bacterium]|nr:lytic murein transglycosylase [Alphaproteobacteria bacterium]